MDSNSDIHIGQILFEKMKIHNDAVCQVCTDFVAFYEINFY